MEIIYANKIPKYKKKAREGEGKKFSALSESKNMYNIVLVVVRHGSLWTTLCVCVCVCVCACVQEIKGGGRAK